MGGVLDAPIKLARSVLGDRAAGLVDPIGNAAFPAQQQAAAAPAAAPADQPKTLLDPTAMPTLTEQRTAKRRDMAAQLARKGRTSTILTQDDGLGAGPG